MKTMSESPWLDRTLIQGPRFALCVTEEQFAGLLGSLDLDARPQMIDEGNACTHRLYPKDHAPVFVVALNADKDWAPWKLYGVLVHEAVHVFQYYCELIGESRPSVEFEAYSIQHIATELMRAYERT